MDYRVREGACPRAETPFRDPDGIRSDNELQDLTRVPTGLSNSPVCFLPQLKDAVFISSEWIDETNEWPKIPLELLCLLTTSIFAKG